MVSYPHIPYSKWLLFGPWNVCTCVFWPWGGGRKETWMEICLGFEKRFSDIPRESQGPGRQKRDLFFIEHIVLTLQTPHPLRWHSHVQVGDKVRDTKFIVSGNVREIKNYKELQMIVMMSLLKGNSVNWTQEEGMATHSSILACRIPWTEEPGRLQSMGSQRVRHN